MTNEFDPNSNFIQSYEEILNIPGEPDNIDKTYDIQRITSGRFVIFQRQRKTNRLHIGEIQVIHFNS